MDNGFEDKQNVLILDKHNAWIKHRSLNLSVYYGFTPHDPASITQRDSEEFTKENIGKTFFQVLTHARELRSYVETSYIRF